MAGHAARRVPVSSGRYALSLAVPLGLLALAYGLWWISDQLVTIGPLDRAKFGWLVVLPLLAATPIATGFAWRSLNSRGLVLATVAVAVGVAAVAAGLLWLSLAGDSAGCQHGTRLPTMDMAVSSALTGIITGGGYAGACAIAGMLIRANRRWLGSVVGAIGGFAVLWIAAFAALASIGFVGICNRPV